MVDLEPGTVEAIHDKLKTKTGVKSMAGLVMCMRLRRHCAAGIILPHIKRNTRQAQLYFAILINIE